MRELNNVGSQLKMIRKDMNLTEKELYAGIISRGHVYRIENNQQALSYEKLKQVLKRLNISLQEFEFLRRGKEVEMVDQVILESYAARSIEEYEAIVKKIEIYLDTEQCLFLERLSGVFKCKVGLKKNRNPADFEEFIQSLWNAMSRKSTFYYRDILLLIHILPFKINGTERIINEVLNSLKKYEQFEAAQMLKVQILFHYVIFLKSEEKFDEAQNCAFQILPVAKEQNQVLIYLEIKYLIAEIHWFKDERECAEKEAEQVFLALDILDEENLLTEKKKQWSDLTSSSKIGFRR
ncbi:transcriptional regulator [Listeria floridensis FSL S10-1187]|uniref:Transcriptional regulator n=2 Tax=Listeria floridensis TaxID=1494962 RepID=A0ABP3B3E9_9LIST|nr:transcriptional regulator [Listeria floridensis FSL S10-1187]